MVQRPYTLADIPQDLTGSTGQVFSADVHGLKGMKSRKRQEIAVAINRQGINIFNVGNLCADTL